MYLISTDIFSIYNFTTKRHYSDAFENKIDQTVNNKTYFKNSERKQTFLWAVIKIWKIN